MKTERKKFAAQLGGKTIKLLRQENLRKFSEEKDFVKSTRMAADLPDINPSTNNVNIKVIQFDSAFKNAVVNYKYPVSIKIYALEDMKRVEIIFSGKLQKYEVISGGLLQFDPKTSLWTLAAGFIMHARDNMTETYLFELQNIFQVLK